MQFQKKDTVEGGSVWKNKDGWVDTYTLSIPLSNILISFDKISHMGKSYWVHAQLYHFISRNVLFASRDYLWMTWYSIATSCVTLQLKRIVRVNNKCGFFDSIQISLLLQHCTMKWNNERHLCKRRKMSNRKLMNS